MSGVVSEKINFITMEYVYSFTGKLSKNVDVREIETLLREAIAAQQKQFQNGSGDDNPSNIVIVDYAYVEAQPNCLIVFANWKINQV